MKRVLLILLPIFVVVFVFYAPVVTTYFTGDDFFHFRVAQVAGNEGLAYIFGFHPFAERGIAFYRPIFRELLYFSFYNIFGLNQLPFRLLQFLMLFINIGLSFVLMSKLFKRKVFAYLVALFVGISAPNVGILYYLAGGIQALGAAMFVLLTLFFYLNYLEKREVKYRFLSYVTFLLALASHETSVVLVALLFFLNITYSRKTMKEAFLQAIKELWPLVAIVLVYFLLEIKLIGFSKEEVQYQAVFKIKPMVNTFSWYTAWAFGLPEMLIDFVGSGLKLNPNLLKYWGDYFRIIFPTFFFSVFVIGSSLIFLIFKKAKIFLNKNFLLLVLWYVGGILPVVVLPLHKSVYYLAVALPAFWGSIFYIIFSAYDLVKKRLKLALAFFVLFVLAAFMLSLVSSQLAKTTYWAKTRGDYARQIIDQIKTKYPDLPNNAVLYLKNDPDYPFISSDWGSSSKQASFILNGSDAINLLYKGRSVSVYYEDMGGLPKDISPKNVFELTVKIF